MFFVSFFIKKFYGIFVETKIVGMLIKVIIETWNITAINVGWFVIIVVNWSVLLDEDGGEGGVRWCGEYLIFYNIIIKSVNVNKGGEGEGKTLSTKGG